MTDDDVREIAVDAGATVLNTGASQSTVVWGVYGKELIAFARMVEAATREECAKLCDSISGNEPSGNSGRFGALDCAEAIREMK